MRVSELHNGLEMLLSLSPVKTAVANIIHEMLREREKSPRKKSGDQLGIEPKTS